MTDQQAKDISIGDLMIPFLMKLARREMTLAWVIVPGSSAYAIVTPDATVYTNNLLLAKDQASRYPLGRVYELDGKKWKRIV